MGTDLNFRSGNLQPGMALGNLPLNVAVTSDNFVINPRQTPFIRLASDNAVGSARTIILTSGYIDGQVIYLTVVGVLSTAQVELANTGNVTLSSGWIGTTGDTLVLQWDMTLAKWKELTRGYGSASGQAGRYTAVTTIGTNVVSASALSCMYSRVGNIVTVGGQTAVVSTAATNTASTFGLSLPIASNLAAVTDLAGSGTLLAASGTASAAVGISGDVANDRARFDYNAAQTASGLLTFNFTYEVI